MKCEHAPCQLPSLETGSEMAVAYGLDMGSPFCHGNADVQRKELMKFKLLTEKTHDWNGKPLPADTWQEAVSIRVEADDASGALAKFRRQILWLTPEMKLRCEPDSGPSLGAQLWEPCERCGHEPSYMQPGGHLCAKCAAKDHPRISTRAPYHSAEPDEQ